MTVRRAVAAAVGAVFLVLVFLQRRDALAFGRVCGLGQGVALGGGVGEQEAAGAGGAAGAQLVHLLGQCSALVLQGDRVAVVVDRAERLVQFDVGAVRQALEDAR